MPKAPVKAQIIIGLFAVLAVAYGLAIERIDQTANGTSLSVVPGQLIAIRFDRAMYSVTSTDPWVVVPMPLSGSPATRAFFLALKPGRATLRAHYISCTNCLTAIWFVDIRVWPSG